MPVLIVVGGLPATGKTTIARAFAGRAAIPYLRVDRIEQALVTWSALTHPVGPVGYAVAHSLAAEQLGLSLDVVVECVNPLAVTRDAWLQTAADAAAAVLEVEVTCSDPAEHRRRVESRPSDVDGLVKPTWAEVASREYEPWQRDHVVIDTAVTPVDETVERLAALVEALRRS